MARAAAENALPEKRKGLPGGQTLCYEHGRSGGIRTHDPHNPIVVRYQAAPRSDGLLRLPDGIRTRREIIPQTEAQVSA